MRISNVLPLAVSVFLCACGGGGGGIGSAGSSPPATGGGSAPTPAPTPTPTNTTVTDLVASQTFASDAATELVLIDRTTSTGINATPKGTALTVAYDASTRSYSLSSPDFSQTFGPDDIQSSDQYETVYFKTGTTRDRLTMVKIPYSGETPTRYVGLGFWQRSSSTTAQQDLLFGTFTYGLDTPAAAVPRTGTAAFDIDVFGVSSFPGREARQFQGSGKFSTDFAAGVFSAQASVTETELVSGGSTVGGGIELLSGGHLRSNGTFDGSALLGSTNGSIGGSLSGRFYGPGAEELGASFTGGKDGTAMAGSFTGTRATAKADNLTLTNLTQSQLFYTQFGYNSVGQLNWQNSETFTYAPPTSALNGGQFTINDKVASSDPNFTTYRKTFAGTFESQDVTLELYKPGTGNTELALTYASFGHWSTSTRFGLGQVPVNQWFAYGLETPARLLSGKTGTGRYAGVVYGSGSTGQNDPVLAVKGTARFDVDFSAQSLSGALAMTGSSANGALSVDFGSFDFSGKLAGYTAGSSFALNKAGQAVGQVETRFFGPAGDEIGGPFSLTVPPGAAGAGTSISGVAAAKLQ